MAQARGTYVEEERCLQGFGWEAEGKEAPGKSRRRWEDNIKMDLQNYDGGVDWITVARDKEQWRVFVNTVMNLGVPQNEGNLLTG